MGVTVEVATTSTLNKVHGKVADKKLMTFENKYAPKGIIELRINAKKLSQG